MDKIKLVVCHPNGSGISRQTAESLKRVEQTEFTFDLLIQLYESASIMHARNATICGKDVWSKSAKVEGFDYILFVDSDIEFTPEHIQMLYDAQAPIVTGVTNPRGSTDVYCCGYWGAGIQGSTPKENMLMAKKYKEDMFSVDWCGAAFLMIRRDVFDKIPHPWFDNIIIQTESATASSTEDVGFCMNAEDAGIPISVIPECIVKHHTRSSFDSEGKVNIIDTPRETIDDIQLQIHRSNTFILNNVGKIVEAYRDLVIKHEVAMEEIAELKKQIK